MQLAVLVGTTPQVIQHLETKAKRRPYSIDVEKLAGMLQTTVNDLFPVATTRPGTSDDPADNETAERSA